MSIFDTEYLLFQHQI